MPNRDKRGPDGEGPRSGYGMGNCTGENRIARFRKRGQGRGFGRRRNFGQANQNNFWVTEQLDSLQSALQKLTAKVDQMNKE